MQLTLNISTKSFDWVGDQIQSFLLRIIEILASTLLAASHITLKQNLGWRGPIGCNQSWQPLSQILWKSLLPVWVSGFYTCSSEALRLTKSLYPLADFFWHYTSCFHADRAFEFVQPTESSMSTAKGRNILL